MWENLDAPQHWVSSPNKTAMGVVFVCFHDSPEIKSYCNSLAHDFKNYENQQELFLLSQLFLTFNLELIDQTFDGFWDGIAEKRVFSHQF